MNFKVAIETRLLMFSFTFLSKSGVRAMVPFVFQKLTMSPNFSHILLVVLFTRPLQLIHVNTYSLVVPLFFRMLILFFIPFSNILLFHKVLCVFAISVQYSLLASPPCVFMYIYIYCLLLCPF